MEDDRERTLSVVSSPVEIKLPLRNGRRSGLSTNCERGQGIAVAKVHLLRRIEVMLVLETRTRGLSFAHNTNLT